MKKIIIGLLAVVLLAPTSVFASFDTNLKIGYMNTERPEIFELQDLLSDQGCFNQTPTGYFGLITFKAVKCFQEKYNLPITGYFGPMSRAVAKNIFQSAITETNKAEIDEIGTTTTNLPQISNQLVVPTPTPIYTPIVQEAPTTTQIVAKNVSVRPAYSDCLIGSDMQTFEIRVYDQFGKEMSVSNIGASARMSSIQLLPVTQKNGIGIVRVPTRDNLGTIDLTFWSYDDNRVVVKDSIVVTETPYPAPAYCY